MEKRNETIEELLRELEEARHQLAEANDTIEAIRTGQVDALVVQNGNAPQLYTLKTADHTYRVFIEQMTEGAVTLNSEGLILYANTRFGAMVSLPLPEVIGLPFQRFIAPEASTLYQHLFKNCWAGDSRGEVTLCHNGQRLPVQLSLTPLELEEGVSLSIIITDLTLQKATQKKLEENNSELAQLNKSLEESNHDLQQFASVASHDLQEPLRKIQLFTNLLKTKAGSRLTEEEGRYMDKVTASAARMKALIIDVLNYSKLSAHDGDFSPTDLALVVKELLDDFELLIVEKGAAIHCGPLPVIEANRGQVRQLLQNLLSNALKFSKAGVPPVIKIKSTRLAQKAFDSPEQIDGPFCLISIADNGIGFDEKYTPTIFSLFERLHSKEDYEGSGIGLAITKKIVEKHCGLIEVESSPGNGSEFKLIFPFKQNA